MSWAIGMLFLRFYRLFTLLNYIFRCNLSMATTTRRADEITMSQQVHKESTTQRLVNESTCAWRVRPVAPTSPCTYLLSKIPSGSVLLSPPRPTVCFIILTILLYILIYHLDLHWTMMMMIGHFDASINHQSGHFLTPTYHVTTMHPTTQRLIN